MSRPRLLDLFCGAGGAALGYDRAGFDVTGVDIKPQHRFPFLDVVQGDAMAVLADVEFCRGFDAIHASPPCQAYSRATVIHGRTYRRYADLVSAVRDGLDAVGRPWVIENVPEAPLRDPLMLCGSMFDLGTATHELRRHRLFESTAPLTPPTGDRCGRRPAVWVAGHPGGSSSRDRIDLPATDEWAVAMEIYHMTAAELAQAIPPAYTEHIGRQLLDALEVVP